MNKEIVNSFLQSFSPIILLFINLSIPSFISRPPLGVGGCQRCIFISMSHPSSLPPSHLSLISLFKPSSVYFSPSLATCSMDEMARAALHRFWDLFLIIFLIALMRLTFFFIRLQTWGGKGRRKERLKERWGKNGGWREGWRKEISGSWEGKRQKWNKREREEG